MKISPQNIKISFDTPIDAKLQGKILQARITATMPDGKVQLTLNDGKTLQAKIEPQLPEGTRINFSVPKDWQST